MASLIQKVAKIANQTFARNCKSHMFQENISSLIHLTKQITASDVNFDLQLVADPTIYCQSCNEAPVTYVPIWEDDVISMGIFVLRNGVTLPLHDHPNMHGVCKVLHGTLKLTQYSSIAADGKMQLPDEIQAHFTPLQIKNYIKACRQPEIDEINVDSAPCVLTPSEGNVHEIQSVNGPAAFLDILAPPYAHDKRRTCHYYKEIPLPNQRNDICWLLEIAQPPEFWCDTQTYKGPIIDYALFADP